MADIFLADMIRAVAKLQPERFEDVQQMARLLGLGWVDEFNGQSKLDGEAQLTLPQHKATAVSAGASESKASPVPSAVSTQNDEDLVESTLEPLPRDSLVPPRWLDSVQVMSTPSPILSRPVLEPLFSPASTRGLLTAALQTRRDDGRVNLEEVLVRLSSGMPLSRLPMEFVPTLGRGVQVLVDKSESMLPFARDQKEVLVQLRRVVGRERVKVDAVTECSDPALVRWGLRQPIPPRGAPLLLLTDLGIGWGAYGESKSSVDAWLKFARWSLQRGWLVVVFVPYPPTRWPKALLSLMRIIQWDRSTTVASVRAQSRSMGGGE